MQRSSSTGHGGEREELLKELSGDNDEIGGAPSSCYGQFPVKSSRQLPGHFGENRAYVIPTKFWWQSCRVSYFERSTMSPPSEHLEYDSFSDFGDLDNVTTDTAAATSVASVSFEAVAAAPQNIAYTTFGASMLDAFLIVANRVPNKLRLLLERY